MFSKIFIVAKFAKKFKLPRVQKANGIAKINQSSIFFVKQNNLDTYSKLLVDTKHLHRQLRQLQCIKFFV